MEQVPTKEKPILTESAAWEKIKDLERASELVYKKYDGADYMRAMEPIHSEISRLLEAFPDLKARYDTEL